MDREGTSDASSSSGRDMGMQDTHNNHTDFFFEHKVRKYKRNERTNERTKGPIESHPWVGQQSINKD